MKDEVWPTILAALIPLLIAVFVSLKITFIG